MMQLKGCPKCSGDLVLEKDEYGNLEQVCLQCGKRIYPEQPAPLLYHKHIKYGRHGDERHMRV